ncbi:ABC transporter ATP-binding protein [Nocardioides humi]|uniref:ABC transporter ATP-binding protein n=1 Tax=Nocardioides humi TaxID=449461 RepID=A0ABN2A6T3_9ACTN|nr:ATP-binding cassette domain-containing protein [Nocardioides humi]
MSELLRVEHLAAGYGRLPVLFDVSFSLEAGEVVALAAGNGAGKSTLLAAMSGVLRPVTGGRVEFRGRDLSRVPAHLIARQGLVHVLERRRLAPFMTVLDNLRLSEATVARVRRAAWRRRFEEARESHELLRSHGERKAGELSGGQQQLVAVVRGLLAEPAVILLDEPFQGLDLHAASQVCAVLEQAAGAGTAVLLTEHRAEVVTGLAHRTLHMDRGRIVDEESHVAQPV